jgi:DNA polymerase-1
MDKKSILIDGNSLLYRMYYGVREMSNAKGVPTNAIYGFTNVLVRIQQEFKPDFFGVAFDLSTPTFRHKVYDAYKAGRDKMPEDLQTQFVLLKELLGKMQVPVIEMDGYEADDIIGTLAKQGEAQGAVTRIITGDRDSFQLVDDQIAILYTTTRSGNQFVTVDPEYIAQKYGVTPQELIEVKALMGDPSDNIPGISGIGEKTALKLVKTYHNLETLYNHLDDLKGKQKERIENGREDAFNSRFLGRICLDAPLPVQLPDLAFKPLFNDEALAMLEELNFRSILKKVGDGQESAPAPDGTMEFSTLRKPGDVIPVLGRLVSDPKVFLIGLLEGEKAWLALRIGSQYYFLPDAKTTEAFVCGMADLPNADDIAVIGHDLKKLTHFFEAFDATIVNYTFDSYIAAYLLSPSDQRYDLANLSEKYLDEAFQDDEAFFGKGKSQKLPSEIDEVALADHLVRQCDILYRLWKEMPQRIESAGMTELMQAIELPLLQIMASMETLGFKIDVAQLEALSKSFEERLEVLTAEIYELAGQTFNINSTKQLGVILFEELKLPPVKKTKTGYSTSVEVLEELRFFHPIIDKILEYRTLSKLDGTYGKGLIKLIDEDTHKIYSTFNQTVAATGRISSSDPNLQNIPVKTEIGREIRKVFIPSAPNRLLVDADYSQIELRVLAHLSGDENLIDAFIKEQDIHTRTASEIFGVPMEDVTREQRGRAKAINFGLIYGKQAFSLGKELGISRKDAQDYIDTYFARYPKVRAYMENVVAQAKEDGYVTTLWGRRRYLPEISSRNRLLVQSGERMALNTPIQGSAADIIKLAMIRVFRRLEAEGLKAQLILQVHDELIVDTPQEEKDRVLALVIEEMEHAAELAVPLKVEAQAGRSWYEVK